MVAYASGAGVQLCPSALDGEAAPFGAASMASSLASAPPCSFRVRFAWPAVAIGRAYHSMVVVGARPHVVPGVEFWRPGDLLVPCLLCSLASEILSFLAIFLEVMTGHGFLSIPGRRHWCPCRASPFLGLSPFHRL